MTTKPVSSSKPDRKKWSGIVRAEIMLEAMCAFHLSSYVVGPVRDCGGVMLVGPPGVLKTTFVDVLDEHYGNAVACSNLNTQTLMRMQNDFVNGNMRSLVIPDLHGIYAGDPRTVARLEQAIMQLVGEGHRGASWQDARFQKFRSRAMVFGALTSKLFEKLSGNWEDSGFLRRFLWSSYRLEDPNVLMNAIEEWRRAEIGEIKIPGLPANSSIPDSLSIDERREIRSWLKYQPSPHEIQFSLLCRATSALRWHYEQRRLRRDALAVMREFAETLQKEAALVRINHNG